MVTNRITLHAKVRQQQRGLWDDVPQFILDFGHAEHRQGYAYYCLRERSLPPYLADSTLARQARPWVVVVGGRGEVVITAYASRNPQRKVRRLGKRRRFGQASTWRTSASA